MKHIVFLIFLTVSLFAAEGKPPSRPQSYEAVTLDSIEGIGLAKLNGTSVLNGLQITGSLISKNATIGFLDIVGDAKINHTNINQESKVTGSLQASHSTFKKPLTLLTQKATFTASRLARIIVQQDLSFKGKQLLELKEKTLVEDGIHFESGKGEVILHSGSQVLGPVTGGKIIKKL